MTKAEREANQARWRLELEAWQESGKALSVWGRERGLSRDALHYWKERLCPDGRMEKTGAGAPVASPGKPLTLIPVKAAAAAASPIELWVGRRRLLLGSGFDPGVLSQVLDVLEARC